MAVSKAGSRLFRVNVGKAWTGKKILKNKNGSITILEPRPFSTGVPKGYADGTGWTPLIINKEMVGIKVAVFTAIETKTKKGRASKDQENFIEQVKLSGGIAGVVRSEDEAIKLIENYRKGND